ncbi:5,6-dimethylbenzimidazole synthase [Gynuella sp.]|uniref:5,6-dimethylbenzimidazole synthase n=1 Tax=Gynuella sp. TaxID=2969146 RepID=UPI003D0F6142
MQFTDKDEDRLMQLMLHRRDIRGNNFLSQELTEQEIEKILMAATTAPSVGLSQPWKFVVIRDHQIRQMIYRNFELETHRAQQKFSAQAQQQYRQLKLDGIIEAPVNIAVYYTPPKTPIIGNNTIPEVGEYSVVCAIQNMWLMARAMNIGMGWVSILNPSVVDSILKAPSGNKLIAYLCIGYVKEFYDIPELEKLNWKCRKSLYSSIVHNQFSEDYETAYDH